MSLGLKKNDFPHTTVEVESKHVDQVTSEATNLEAQATGRLERINGLLKCITSACPNK